MTDPIADLLIRIKNAVHAGHDALNCPRSNLKVEVLKVLQTEGFIESFDEMKDTHQGSINIVPRYIEDALSKTAVLRGVKRISKPSRRVYVKKEDIPRVRNGLGIAILTTASGVLTDKQARDRGVGGEVLCYVW
jgi:small subunit ribosomal protein S8